MEFECASPICFLKSLLRPFQEHALIRWYGHLIIPYTQTSWCLAMCWRENNSRQPRSLLTQGYFCLLAMSSRATFLISENSALHVEQCWTLSLHLLQMLWPLVHSFMGGTIYSIHTGHSRFFNRASSKARDKSSISRTYVSHVFACC